MVGGVWCVVCGVEVGVGVVIGVFAVVVSIGMLLCAHRTYSYSMRFGGQSC